MSFHPLRLVYLLREVWVSLIRPVRLGVRIILMQEDKVLLVRHTYMPGWHFPGGAMNRLETPLEAAAREAREEAGVELLEPPTLVGIVTSYIRGRSDHVVVYFCRNFRTGTPTDKWEIAERKLFEVDALPVTMGNRWRKMVLDLAAQNGKG